MQYQAKVVLDTLCVDTKRRITTMELTYPRFIHAEFMTHRDRARNAASSRAIPFATLSKTVEKDPVFPLQWQLAQKGMQGGDEIPEALRPLARAIWQESLDNQLRHAANLEDIGATALALATRPCRYAGRLTVEESDAVVDWVRSQSDAHQTRLHKTMPNRLIEPWMPITVVTTATEWKNFFRLRCHPDAEIHFQQIANLAREALDQSEPRPVQPGAWHLPYVIGMPDEKMVWEFANSVTDLSKTKISPALDILCRISSARCARVSYMTHDGQHDPAKDRDSGTGRRWSTLPRRPPKVL